MISCQSEHGPLCFILFAGLLECCPEFVEKMEEKTNLCPTTGGLFNSAAGFKDDDSDQRHFGEGIEVSETVSNQLRKYAALCRV